MRRDCHYPERRAGQRGDPLACRSHPFYALVSERASSKRSPARSVYESRPIRGYDRVYEHEGFIRGTSFLADQGENSTPRTERLPTSSRIMTSHSTKQNDAILHGARARVR